MPSRLARRRSLRLCGAAVSVLAVGACGIRSGQVLDEAMRAERSPGTLSAADQDYFRDMDRGMSKDPEAVWSEIPFFFKPPPAPGRDPEPDKDAAVKAFVRGRNNWLVWTGGNDRLWDFLANNSFGALDFLKTLSSHPRQEEPTRADRWYELGLVNEPCFEQVTSPNPDRYGLYLDRRLTGPDCPPDPFADESLYPGIEIGARGKTVAVGSYYGEASGVVGLRLFPNPDFDEDAAEHWDAERYYSDPSYYQDDGLVRPYRVGMSCAFCHVGPSPIDPPDDFANPRWENLNSNPGAQYFWVDRIFYWRKTDRDRNFFYQMFHTSLPGTLDTSLVSSDNINNPRTMNAIYGVKPRLDLARRWGESHLAGGELLNKQFNDYAQTAVLSDLFEPPGGPVKTPRVLKDGADSVGVLGALNRVYINIGLFSEEWMTHFIPLLGGRITPIELEVVQKNSAYWQATEEQTADLALFLYASARPDRLADAPGGGRYLQATPQQMTRGKLVFAENCARCHSSKQPANLCEPGTACVAGDIMHNSESYFDWMRTEVQEEDFLENNYLSTDQRVAVTELGTNACSPLATNAIAENIWDNFSSQTYKELPAVGKVTVHDPWDGSPWQYDTPGGGRGYTRVPSLISLWATAPYLLNNAVGDIYQPADRHDYDGQYGSVEGRMRTFEDSIEKMLWPDKRVRDDQMAERMGLPANRALDNVPGYIQRTTATSYLWFPGGYLPGPLDRFGDQVIGPIPKGFPVGLLTNMTLIADGERLPSANLVELGFRLFGDLGQIRGDMCETSDATDCLSEEEADMRAWEVLGAHLPDILALSKCPDFVVNRGHYYGSNLADPDKRALIEFLKTF